MEESQIKCSEGEHQSLEIHGYPDSGKVKEFYDVNEAVTGPAANLPVPLRSEDGITLLKDISQILKRWSTYFSSLLNKTFPIDKISLDGLLTFPIVPEMDAPPTIVEVETAKSVVKTGKATGPDGILPEVYCTAGTAETYQRNEVRKNYIDL